MTSPREALEAVARTIADSGQLPSDMGLVMHEADGTSSDADVDLPAIEIQLQEADPVVTNNTDFVGHVTDDNGNDIARVYLSEYEMVLSINIWTTTDDGYNPDDLGERLRKALYRHSSYGPQVPLPDEERNPIDEITYVRLGTGERNDDLLQTPTVRRWSQELELWGYEEFRTDETYIVDVNGPAAGDLNDSEGDGTVDNT